MSNATDTLEAALGNALFLGQSFPTITAWKVCLYSSAPNDAAIGGNEIMGNGYAPVNHNPSAANWTKVANQDSSGNTVFRNALSIGFATATANWLTVTHFGLKNQLDQLYFVAPLTTAKVINAGDTPVFLAGELEIAIG